jgi:hypothetical protein
MDRRFPFYPFCPCARNRNEIFKKIKKAQEGEGRENMPRTRAANLWKEELWKIKPQIVQLS